ncbi:MULTISPECIES: GNAT family N-acetyltransferase [Micrococcaceae]|uniref:GNAT family N-acetyltransferase n=1 Tax=Micrococcaceae TaxID=1268 RepID=UPI000CFCD1A2|nr:GNAT family N-acetyltransferase [Arthrobacter sp. MYb214]PRB76763.1 GNAT family N-acetyltransferase [Arthrobacter sp. MYb214]
MDVTSAIRSARRADIPSASSTLAEAFAFYPWTRWSIPADRYLERLERLQAVYLSHALEHGVVLVSEDLDGVAALLPPSCPEPGLGMQEEISQLMGDRLEITYGADLPQRPENAWDFATLGVAGSSVGRGLGSALISRCLNHIAASDYPEVSLETSNERNVRLYERHGFEVLHRTAIAEGPVVYTMGANLG